MAAHPGLLRRAPAHVTSGVIDLSAQPPPRRNELRPHRTCRRGPRRDSPVSCPPRHRLRRTRSIPGFEEGVRIATRGGVIALQRRRQPPRHAAPEAWRSPRPAHHIPTPHERDRPWTSRWARGRFNLRRTPSRPQPHRSLERLRGTVPAQAGRRAITRCTTLPDDSLRCWRSWRISHPASSSRTTELAKAV
jgi:hypothetical protein